ncbi:MAG: lipopolysaccharide heptosyltransferase II [Myxococcota bacterium]|jgi:heptosyltransferase-2|nr:lipopolysaccharide heptosyltransferase II [Myxococcota bacterium]
MDPAAVRSILVRAPNWVGDVVMATPGLRALRNRYEDARIVVQVRPGLEGLLQGTPFIDEVRTLTSYHRGLRAMSSEARALRHGERFDLGICIPESFSSALLLRMSGVRRVVGYAGGLREPLLHQSVPVPSSWGRRRMVARETFVLGLMHAVGCKEDDTRVSLATTEEEEASASALLESHGIANTEPVVALAPGASYGAAKCWPAGSFAEVGDHLAATGNRVLLLGAPDEASITAAVASAMKQPAVDLAGQADLAISKALIRRTRLVICNDAGARHVAVGFGVPAIVFFGPTAVEKTNLNLESIAVFETRDSCRPCYRRTCPIDHRCMTGIDPQSVIPEAERLLEASFEATS